MKRKNVGRELPCDTDRLYGSLSDAIAYLSEVKAKHPKARLQEHWPGYESMEIRFYWVEEETDEEFEMRKKLIEFEKQRIADREAREKEANDLAYKRELEAVNRKYGK